MEKIRTSHIIHGFALLHAAVTVVCSLLGIGDTLCLTALTMAMTVIICLKDNLTVELSAVCIILVNIFGFILGNIGAEVADFGIPALEHALSTFIATELIGWALHGFAKRFFPPRGTWSWRQSWGRNLGWLLFAMVVVFGLRVYINHVFSGSLFSGTNGIELLSRFLGNALSLLVMVTASILFIQRKNAPGREQKLERTALGTILFLGMISCLCALIVTLELPFRLVWPPSLTEYSRNAVLALLVESTLFCVTYIVTFALRMQREADEQRAQRHRAEFRYMALKHQVNPHFLFNSLNVLDSIVQDGTREEASSFIHKLSGIYRYLLQHEDEQLVRLSDEIAFAQKYRELLQIRFPEGFVTENHVREEDLVRRIVPCTLQLLLENATKHNAISTAHPLVVTVTTDGKTLTLRNNRIPKVSAFPSNGIGLQYIRERYLDLSGTAVKVEQSADSFSVTIPLLED